MSFDLKLNLDTVIRISNKNTTLRLLINEMISEGHTPWAITRKLSQELRVMHEVTAELYRQYEYEREKNAEM